jgi:hypothetical protein
MPALGQSDPGLLVRGSRTWQPRDLRALWTGMMEEQPHAFGVDDIAGGFLPTGKSVRNVRNRILRVVRWCSSGRRQMRSGSTQRLPTIVASSRWIWTSWQRKNLASAHRHHLNREGCRENWSWRLHIRKRRPGNVHGWCSINSRGARSSLIGFPRSAHASIPRSLPRRSMPHGLPIQDVL